MFALLDSRAIAGHEIQPAVVAAKNRVRVVIPAGVEFVSDPPQVNQLFA